FARMKRKMAEVNKRQAFVIEGAEILHNDRGTAPGQWVEDSGRVVVLLPGPPHELKAMYERQVQPRLARVVPKQVIRTLQMRDVANGGGWDARIGPRPAYLAGLQEIRESGHHDPGGAVGYPGPPPRPRENRG